MNNRADWHNLGKRLDTQLFISGYPLLIKMAQLQIKSRVTQRRNYKEF